MKRILIAVFTALISVGAASADPISLGTFAVSPEGTFSMQDPNDTCSQSFAAPGCNMAPTFISLSSLGIWAGDTIGITDVGELCIYRGAGCLMYAASATYLGAVFDSNDVLLGPSNLNRLPGAIASGLPNISSVYLNEYYTGASTTIPQDFYVPTTVVIPPGAQYLVVSVLDSFYADNSGNGTLGVSLTLIHDPPPPGSDPPGPSDPPSVPEPGTSWLAMTGVGGLLGLRRVSHGWQSEGR